MKKFDHKLVIAIDGYSSCGKSTFAKAIAKELGYIFIDSGAMYRAVTLYCIQNNFIKNDNNIQEDILINSLNKITIDFRQNSETKKVETFLNGKNVEDEIRSIKVSGHVSNVSKIKEIRTEMVRLQQKMGVKKGIIMDGRDIGTTVFPNADLKIFMTAGVDIRAKRRHKELIQKGLTVNYEDIKSNISNRDYIDENRKESPLRKADDAILLDNSYMTPDEQLKWVLKLINEKF